MKKGTKITRVVISSGKVTAYARVKNGDEFVFPLTRSQRNLFLKKDLTYIGYQLMKEFGNADILDPDFEIEVT